VTTVAESPRAARRRPGRVAAVACAYFLIAAIYTHPVLQRSFTGIANDPYDPILNTSILWWNATTVPFSPAWWSPPHFHPSRDVAAFTENLVGVSVLATPLFWLTGSALAAYNICFYLSWPLSALATYLLVWFLVRRHDAAFLAGLAWAFTPYRTAELGHLQMLSVYWLPLVLLGLHGYLEQRRGWWLALFGAAWVLQALANGYFIFFGAVFIGLWLLYFCARRDEWRAALGILGAWVVANLLLFPVLWNYYVIHQRYGLRRSVGEALAFSAPASAWFEVSSVVWFWHKLLPESKDDLFPGLTMVLLVAAGVWASFKSRQEPRRWSPPRRGWLIALSVCVLAISATAMIVTMIIGPWSRTVLGVTLRMTTLDRALLLTVVSGAGLVFLLGRLRKISRSHFRFYVGATIAMAVLCCGPQLRVGDAVVLDEMPYWWLMKLPGFDSVRVPTRFWMLGTLCLAIAAGISFARYGPSRPSTRRALFAVLAAAIMLDGWTNGIGMPDAPAQWPRVERRDRTAAVIELPLGPSWDAAATFRAMRHRRPVVNGVSGYDPPFYAPLQDGLNSYEPAVLTALASFAPLDVVVNGDADPDGAWARYAASVAGEPFATDGVRRVYHVPHSPAPSVTLGPALPIAAVSASGQDVSLAHDGRMDTAWYDHPRQLPSHWMTVDLGQVHGTAGVTMWLGEWARDFPRLLAIDLSTDGLSWTTMWNGNTVAMAILGAVASPRECALRVAFDERPARFVRLRSLSDHKNLWRVAEVQIHAPRTN
jgi:hypothetical protein